MKQSLASRGEFGNRLLAEHRSFQRRQPRLLRDHPEPDVGRRRRILPTSCCFRILPWRTCLNGGSVAQSQPEKYLVLRFKAQVWHTWTVPSDQPTGSYTDRRAKPPAAKAHWVHQPGPPFPGSAPAMLRRSPQGSPEYCHAAPPNQ